MASPSSPPSSRSSPVESRPTSSASRTPHPKNANAESRSRGPATHNRYPAAPSSANGIPQSRPPPLAQFPRLRPYLPRLLSASPRAIFPLWPYLPQKNSSLSHIDPSSSNQTAARAPSFSRQLPTAVPSAKTRSPRQLPAHPCYRYNSESAHGSPLATASAHLCRPD